MTTSQKNRLETLYAQSLMGNPTLPKTEEERSWLYSQYEQSRIVADNVPADRRAQLRFAILQANFGNNDDAIQLLEALSVRFPEDSDIWIALGGIHFYRGNSDAALRSFLAALQNAKTSRQRALANFKLGEHLLFAQNEQEADSRFVEALKYDPSLSVSIESVRNRRHNQ